MENPLVSIILPCRNESACIEKCINDILAQEVPEGGFELIVADGRSEDGTREILARFARRDPRVHVIDNPGLIVSTGLNAAIKSARGRIIIRMDAHSEYSNSYVATCARLLRDTGADNVGGPARTTAKTYIERAVAAAFHSPFSVGGARFHDINFEGNVDTVTYGCWERSNFERFGFFDEELVRNQDDEYNLRIIRSGGKIWQSPSVKSWYRPRGSLVALFRQYAQYGYWKVRVIQKHRIPASWRHLVPVTTLVGLLSLVGLWLFCSLYVSRPSAVGLVGRFAGSTLCWFAAAYALVACTASIVCAYSAGWSLLPLLPAVFGCYHLGYAWGFLCGVWDFVIMKRAPASWASNLTRSSMRSEQTVHPSAADQV